MSYSNVKRITRVRWTSDERAAVISRAQSLLVDSPRLPLRTLFSRSQECLSKERRRPANPGAANWLHKELKQAGPPPSPVTVWRRDEAVQSSVHPDTQQGPNAQTEMTDLPQAAVEAAKTSTAPDTTSLTALLVDAGVQVVTGILRDPRVRAAWKALIADGARAADGPTSTPSDGAEVQKDKVIVAGCTAEEARVLAHQLQGAIPIEFWTPDEPRERLVELLPHASLVVGVAAGLSQPIESSLARLGHRFVRHRGSMQGLYRRLAEHAMTSPRPAADATTGEP